MGGDTGSLFLSGAARWALSQERLTGQNIARLAGSVAAKSSGHGAARSYLTPPDVHLVGTGPHPVL